MSFSINNSTETTPKFNDKQQQAINLELTSSSLILAGAGSGKTSVLTHRIAYILNNDDINLENILALTFTNKAAAEMKQRLQLLINRPINYTSWIGTFHGIAHKILRINHHYVGLPNNFQILDSSEQLTKIKRIVKELNIDDKKFKPTVFMSFINSNKDEGLRAKDINPENNFFIKKAIEVYQAYQEECEANFEIDFAELLFLSYELLLKNPEVLQKYQKQFKYILIDEFQDTNSLQYKLIKLLKNNDNTIFCVGDDDQSIYGWRGAKITNINNLSSDFAPLEIIKLEQNYRSSANILNASNAVIAKNKNRMSKSLWTSGNDGELIDVFIADNGKHEADFIVKNINKLANQEVAILYRTNALSRTIEEALIKNNIKYSIYGGLRFFDRREIKDALAYLRLSYNQNDNNALIRIINFPTRGISANTLDLISQYAIKNKMFLLQAAQEITDSLPSRAANAVNSFVALILDIQKQTNNLSLGEKLEYIINKSGLVEYYAKDKTDKGQNKIENLEELIGAGEDFVNDDPDMDDTLSFISSAMLDSGDKKEADVNVKLMTIHSAKGLEFDNVFIIALEEDLFPSRKSIEELGVDEERRLCYVAMTRAKKKLHLSLARNRYLYGINFNTSPSRFLKEIPMELLNQVYLDRKIKEHDITKKVSASSNKEFNGGDKVLHKKFGLGIVKNYEAGANPRVEVNFNNFGSKWLILEYANLEKLS